MKQRSIRIFLVFFSFGLMGTGQCHSSGLYPISSLEFNSSSQDLVPLERLVSNSEVVAIGESIHTNGSYHQGQARIAKYLIEKQGFRTLLIETPWWWTRYLNAYVHECAQTVSPVKGLQLIFPQFASQELANLYTWIRTYNCANPSDQVQLLGFDIQQVNFDGTYVGDTWPLELFVTNSVSSLTQRLAELRKCGPSKSQPGYRGPANDKDLSDCENFLNDLSPYISNQKDFELKLASTALVFSARKIRYEKVNQSTSLGFRDEGMAAMITLLQSYLAKKAVVIAHLGHVTRDFQDIYSFATKSMGSHLNKAFGKKYFVLGEVSYKLTQASWNKEQIYYPGIGSLEKILFDMNQGSLLVDIQSNSIFPAGSKAEVLAFKNVQLSKHFDALLFIPETAAMTNYPGVHYP